jgi:predicted HNH restriction endonuclease
MDINITKKKLIDLVVKINEQHPSIGLAYHQQDVTKKNMCVEGCNGKMWIEPMSNWYDISLSGQSLTLEMTGYMKQEFGEKTGNKQSKPEPSHQPFWRVDDFKLVEKAVFRYAGITQTDYSYSSSEEIVEPEKYFEGALKRISVNIYERNTRARNECIEHYGLKCSICSFDFETIYGEIGKGFIHVHHIKPISEIAKEYSLDPIKDLRPVCPNCHSMIHRTQPALSIEEVKERFDNCHEN